MHGDPRISDLLNQVLRKELTGINQYSFIPACARTGVGRPREGPPRRGHRGDEARRSGHSADPVPRGGCPTWPTTIGSLWVRLPVSSSITTSLEHGALAVLRPAIALCLEVGDHVTRDLLERIIVDEERHIDWIEAQQHKISEVGYQQYLAQQIYA